MAVDSSTLLNNGRYFVRLVNMTADSARSHVVFHITGFSAMTTSLFPYLLHVNQMTNLHVID